jgi:hypothetical protein
LRDDPEVALEREAGAVLFALGILGDHREDAVRVRVDDGREHDLALPAGAIPGDGRRDGLVAALVRARAFEEGAHLLDGEGDPVVFAHERREVARVVGVLFLGELEAEHLLFAEGAHGEAADHARVDAARERDDEPLALQRAEDLLTKLGDDTLGLLGAIEVENVFAEGHVARLLRASWFVRGGVRGSEKGGRAGRAPRAARAQVTRFRPPDRRGTVGLTISVFGRKR